MIYEVKDISNYYGVLSIMEYEDKYYWGITDYNSDEIKWKEIAKELFEALKVKAISINPFV